MLGPLIWYQICNCNHHNFEEIFNFQFSKMSTYSWICPPGCWLAKEMAFLYNTDCKKFFKRVISGVAFVVFHPHGIRTGQICNPQVLHKIHRISNINFKCISKLARTLDLFITNLTGPPEISKVGTCRLAVKSIPVVSDIFRYFQVVY